MRKLLVKAGVPLAAGALVLGGTSVAASASSSTPHAIPTYTIAYEGPLSGGYVALGLNMKYAVQYAVYHWNQTKGRRFNLKAIFLDDQGNQSISPTEAQIAISNHNVVGVVGPAFSGATLAAQAKYGPAHMPLVSPSASAIKLGTPSENPDRNFFRLVADDGIQGPSDGKYVVDTLKIKNVYVISDGSNYGAGLAAQVSAKVHALGGTVNTNTLPETSGCVTGGASTSEYSTIGSLVNGAGAKMVFYGGYYCDAGLLISALRTQGYTGKFMSGDGSDDPHLVTSTTPHSDANGAYLSCACAAVSTATAAGRAFTLGYERYSHGVPPGTYSPESFDALNTFIYAMNALLNAHKAITRANIVAQLHMTTYVGLTKTIKFRAYGDIAGTAIYVSKVENGKIVQLGLE